MPCEGEEVGGEHGGADVGMEGEGAFPDAAGEAEDALEERDTALDAGAEVAEFAIDPAALDHVEHGEAALLGPEFDGFRGCEANGSLILKDLRAAGAPKT